MAYRIYGAFVACVGAVALILAADETFAGPGAAHVEGSAVARPTFRPPVARSLHHHRGNHVGAVWPGDFFDGPSNDEPRMDVTPSASADIHHTYTYDVPWDAVHRFPPQVTPSERPY